jgi:glycosyltransferase involved in cell wall biosynthesis
VLLCTYNGERYIDEALRSIQEQRLTDIEILVVDDGSTDQTGEILARHAAEDTRIRVERIDHRGVASARNHGLELARSRWVAMMDDDDIALPERLERQLAYLDAHPGLAALGTWAWHIGPRGRRSSVSDVGPVSTHELDRIRSEGKAVYLITPTVVLDRDAARAIGGFRPWVFPAGDIDLWTRLADTGTVLVLPERLLLYRVHRSSISSSRLGQQMDMFLLIEENARRRRAGRPELGVAEFQALLRTQSRWRRMQRARIWRARYQYRVAGALLADRDPRGLLWLAGSVLLAPSVVLGRLRRQLIPRFSARAGPPADRP